MNIEKKNSRGWFVLTTATVTFFLARWLIIENHSLFGDECSFIQFYTLGFNKIHESEDIFELLKNIYIFNPTYPGGMYWLSAPFALIGNNSLFSFRLFIGVIHLIGVVFFYKTLKEISSPFLAFCGCLILTSSTFWITRSHYYLTDGIVGVEIIAILYFFTRYFKSKSLITLAITGLLLSFCFLTKFSFIIYLLPLISAWILTEYSIDRLLPIKYFIKKILILTSPSIILAGPWYYNHLFSNNTIISRYKSTTFFIRKNNDLATSISSWFSIERSDLSLYFFIVLLFFLTIYFIKKIISIFYNKKINIEKFVKYQDQEKYVIISSILFIVIVSIILELLGRSWITRWNFNSYFLIILLIWAAHRTKARKSAVILFLSPLIISILYLHSPILDKDIYHKYPIISPLIQKHYSPYLLRPNSESTNVEKIVASIAQHNSSTGNGPYAASAANFHIHEYAHNGIFEALDAKNQNDLPAWRYLYIPWEAKPIEVEQIFGLDVRHALRSYLVLRKQNLDAEIIPAPWCRLFRTLPQSFWQVAEKVTTIPSPGRAGIGSDFEIYHLSKMELNVELLYDLAKAAERVEAPRYRIYQQIKRVYYGLLSKKEPVEKLLKEGSEVLYRIQNDPSIKKDPTLQHKLLLFSEKLGHTYDLLEVYGVPETIYRKENLPLLSSYQIEPLQEDDGFKALGDDPQLYLAIPAPDKGPVFDIHVRIEVPADTSLQIFYKPKTFTQFNEDLSQPCAVVQGENNCIFSINRDHYDGNLRLDPGNHRGWYRLKGITVYESNNDN